MRNELEIQLRTGWTELQLCIEQTFEAERLAILMAEDRLFYHLPRYLARKASR